MPRLSVKRAGGDLVFRTEEHFDGEVVFRPFIDEALEQPVSSGDNLHLVLFSKGSRTKWHTHDSRQLLIFTAGRGRVETDDGEVVEAGIGDIVVVPAGVVHRHGASEDDGCTHLAIQRGGATWL